MRSGVGHIPENIGEKVIAEKIVGGGYHEIHDKGAVMVKKKSRKKPITPKSRIVSVLRRL